MCLFPQLPSKQQPASIDVSHYFGRAKGSIRKYLVIGIIRSISLALFNTLFALNSLLVAPLCIGNDLLRVLLVAFIFRGLWSIGFLVILGFRILGLLAVLFICLLSFLSFLFLWLLLLLFFVMFLSVGVMTTVVSRSIWAVCDEIPARWNRYGDSSDSPCV